jgi:lipoprotein-anchoring transpeptidase ErfK/SrfK
MSGFLLLYKHMKATLFIGILVFIVMLPQSALASHKGELIISSIDDSVQITLPVTNEVGGLSFAVTDLGDDNVSEVIVGNGMSSEPRVHVLRQDGTGIGSFLAYAPTLGTGINVITCDLTDDGYPEIITSPQKGGGPHIRVFNRFGKAIDNGGFFAYNTNMREGVNLACGKLSDDQPAELITLPASGGGPHVRIWKWKNEMKLTKEFFAYNATDRSGIVGVVNNKKLFLAQQKTKHPLIKTFVIHNDVDMIEEEQHTINALGIQSLSISDNQLFASTTSNQTLVNITTGERRTLPTQYGSLNITSDNDQIYYTSGRLQFHENSSEKHIEVDVSEQRLYAWERGVLRNSFLISSGLNNATPLGNHKVLAKIPKVHYAWNYGPDNPNNYDLGWIDYNLRIYPHIYIHYAPWHNNFGHKMSHGCVNVSLSNMKWIYNWADESIEVVVKK